MAVVLRPPLQQNFELWEKSNFKWYAAMTVFYLAKNKTGVLELCSSSTLF